MGRLFWKFFFAFWLALLTAGVLVGTTFVLYRSSQNDAGGELLLGGPAAFLVQSASVTLRHGGKTALGELLEQARHDPMAILFAVDEAGRDILGRPVPQTALAQARSLAAAESQPPAARRVGTTGGQAYLLFAAAGEAGPPFPGMGPPSVDGRFPPAAAGEMHPRPPPLVPILVGILASLGASALLAWHLSKPIRVMRRAFDAISEGRLDTRVGPLMGRRRDEVADLGKDFDHMAQHLQALVGSQRRLLHDVSHELRSPLARLQAAIGLARQDPGKMDSTLERIERESMRLDGLVGELLTLSRLEAGTGGAALATVDLMELAETIAADARFEARADQRDVDFSGTGEAIAQVRVELVYRAFENVIRNAVKYTRVNSTIEVAASIGQAGDRFHLVVADRGPGVPEGDLDAIFEPFYRGENGQSATGFGLGLAIARRAVEVHGGQVRARNRAGGGLVVEMAVPLNTMRMAGAAAMPRSG